MAKVVSRRWERKRAERKESWQAADVQEKVDKTGKDPDGTTKVKPKWRLKSDSVATGGSNKQELQASEIRDLKIDTVKNFAHSILCVNKDVTV